jgi:hypothetical protein
MNDSNPQDQAQGPAVDGQFSQTVPLGEAIPLVVAPAVGETAAKTVSPFWQSLDAKADWLSDYVNPIVVKEIRQALKSRAFVLTFSAVLLFAWSWSIFGIALRAPSIYYVPSGRYMLLGYFVIMLLPLVLVIPFATFRSLAAEREDGTYELLSITNLKPWQVVLGKLSGAILQIAIFLSALSPCLAITYFLRGIDIFMILLFIGATTLASILLCGFALVVAAQARQQRFQTASAIALLFVLSVASFACGSAGFGMIISGVVADIRSPLTWIGIAMAVSMWACLLSLFVLGAAASITFPSDNRATPLRVAILVTHAVWFGWITFIWQFNEFDEEVLYAYVMPSLLFWWLAAAHTTGESTRLTPRVRRGLPESFLGRIFGTLFFPGRGIGYFFVLGNLITMLILTAVLENQSRGSDNIWFTAFMGCCYVTAYVGLANLIMRASARGGREGSLRGFSINLALIWFGAFIPLSIQWSYQRIYGQGYHPMQASNVVWSMAEITDGSLGDILSLQGGIFRVPLLVSFAALVMLVVNFALAAREMLAARAPVPVRVMQEQVSLRGQPPIEAGPQSPWDDVRAPSTAETTAADDEAQPSEG